MDNDRSRAYSNNLELAIVAIEVAVSDLERALDLRLPKADREERGKCREAQSTLESVSATIRTVRENAIAHRQERARQEAERRVASDIGWIARRDFHDGPKRTTENLGKEIITALGRAGFDITARAE